jgi:hypothetical protein
MVSAFEASVQCCRVCVHSVCVLCFVCVCVVHVCVRHCAMLSFYLIVILPDRQLCLFVSISLSLCCSFF